MRFGSELKSIRGQSVGEDRTGLQLVDKLVRPWLYSLIMNKNGVTKETLVRGNKYKPQ